MKNELYFCKYESELIEKNCMHHLAAATSASFQADWIDMCFHLNISSSSCPWQPFGSRKPVVGQAALAKLVYTAAHLTDNRSIIDSKIISLRPRCLVSKQHQDDTADGLVAHEPVGHQWHGDRLFGRKSCLHKHSFTPWRQLATCFVVRKKTQCPLPPLSSLPLFFTSLSSDLFRNRS